MTIPVDAQHVLDRYLNDLRERLQRLSEGDAQDIVREIRSHIVERALESGALNHASIDFAIATLGSPSELAESYLSADDRSPARSMPAPARTPQGLFRWLAVALNRCLVLLLSSVGYALSAALLLCALLKPFHPYSAGLWRIPDPNDSVSLSLRMGLSSQPGSGEELLGWWIVPLALLLGAALIRITYLFGKRSIRAFMHSVHATSAQI